VGGIRIQREAGTTVRTASYLPQEAAVFCRFLSSRKVLIRFRVPRTQTRQMETGTLRRGNSSMQVGERCPAVLKTLAARRLASGAASADSHLDCQHLQAVVRTPANSTGSAGGCGGSGAGSGPYRIHLPARRPWNHGRAVRGAKSLQVLVFRACFHRSRCCEQLYTDAQESKRCAFQC